MYEENDAEYEFESEVWPKVEGNYQNILKNEQDI